MDDFIHASIFAEDLMMYITDCLNITWCPLTTAYKFRGLYESEFRVKIGEVVLQLCCNAPLTNPEIPPEYYINLYSANKYLSEKFFRFGNDFFNLLDYCGQLAYIATSILQREIGAIDSCAIYIASTIAKSIDYFKSHGKSDTLPSNVYWEQLWKKAVKITPFITKPELRVKAVTITPFITKPDPIYQPLLLHQFNPCQEVQRVL